MKTLPKQQASLWDLAPSSSSDFHAPTYPSLAEEKGLLESIPASGLSAFDSFARYDPVSSSWRTSRRSLAGDLMLWQGAFPRAAMILSGTAWQLVPCMLRIGETESSSSPGDETWSTPTSREWKDGASAAAAAIERGSYPTLGRQVLLTRELWPTIRAGDPRNSRAAITNKKQHPSGCSSLQLEQAVEVVSGVLPRELNSASELPPKYKRLWPTPDAGVFNDGQTLEVWQARHAKELAKGYNGNGGGTPLAMAVKMPPKMFPTPRASDGNGGAGRAKTTQGGDDLQTATKKLAMWPTPRASPNENRQTSPSPSQIAGTHGRSLAAEACESVRKNWPTPEAADATRGSMTHMRGNPTLLGATKMWPTPTSTDSADSARATCTRTKEWQSNAGTTLTDAARLSEAGLPVEAVAPELAGTGSLNPAWVSQLMGFPEHWTEFDLPATAGPRARKKPSTTGKRLARSKPVPAAKVPSEGNA